MYAPFSFGTWILELTFCDIGRKAALSIKAVNRMASLAHHSEHDLHPEHDPGKAQMRKDISKYKEESARVRCLFIRFFCKTNRFV